jgi:phosphonate transport system substrate-binding protein
VIVMRTVSGTVLRAATFGCVPVVDDEATRVRLSDLSDAIGAALGIAMRPHRAPSPGALANAFRSGRVHIAWTSPALVTSDAAFVSARPLVRSVRHGSSTYHGVLFARAGGRIRDLADLRGARVAWVAPTSAGGYLVPRLALAELGVSPVGLFAEEMFVGSHGAVADAVREGRADVGAVYASYDGGDGAARMLSAGFAPSGEGLDAWRVLAVGGPIPSDVLVASDALLHTVRVDPVAALSHLHDDARARDAMQHLLGADAFEPCDLDALEELKARLERAHALTG